jgi:hypothetical protein
MILPMQCGNLKALFAVEAIPKDTALRESLDAVATEALNPAFEIFLQRLQRGKQLAAYSFLDGHYLAGTPTAGSTRCRSMAAAMPMS